jgi:Holliday junction resolvase RusA-like endonuclease
MRLRVTLPLPPSIGTVYRKRGHGRGMFMTKEGTDFKKEAIMLIQMNKPQIAGATFYEGQRFSLKLTLHFPDRRRCDIDNRVKLCQDALADALGFDDKQIDQLIVERGEPDKARPRCELFLTDNFTPTP